MDEFVWERVGFWVVLVLLIVCLGTGVYLYKRCYVPLIEENKDLVEENKTLLELADELKAKDEPVKDMRYETDEEMRALAFEVEGGGGTFGQDEKGAMVFYPPHKIFQGDSSSALSREGRTVLRNIGSIITDFEDYRLTVEVVDSVSWVQAASRSAEVVSFLIGEVGVDFSKIKAGFSYRKGKSGLHFYLVVGSGAK